MARAIANVNILTDTTQSFIDRYNALAFSYSTEAVTANSTLGVTGTVANPVNARIFGTFAANTVNSHVIRSEGGEFVANSTMIRHGGFNANTTIVNLGTAQLSTSTGVGANNQVLTSSGPGQPPRWTSISGVGTVTSITAGNGLNGNTITSSGTLSVRPADTSIVVGTFGIQVNTAWVQAVTSNASQLLGQTWASPGSIGTNTANSGIFTNATINNTLVAAGSNFIANSTGTFVQGLLQCQTPSAGVGFRLRASSASSSAIMQVTDNTGSNVLTNITFNNTGYMTQSSGATFTSLGVGTGITTNNNGEIRASGDILAFQTSDIRLKTNLVPITNAVDKLVTVGGYTFTWTDDALKSKGGEDGYFVRSRDVGVIAQEIESIVPEAVVERADGIKAVRYDLLVPILIQAIKELNARIEVLER